MSKKIKRGPQPCPTPCEVEGMGRAELESGCLSGPSKEEEKQTTTPEGLRFSITLQRSILPATHKAGVARQRVMSVDILFSVWGTQAFRGDFCASRTASSAQLAPGLSNSEAGRPEDLPSLPPFHGVESGLRGHRAPASGRTKARNQGPSRLIALHSHLPATSPVPWPPEKVAPW